MDQRVSFISLAASDLQATEKFYVDGLGWEVASHRTGQVLTFAVADRVMLSFWAEASFEAVCGKPVQGGNPRVVLAHHVATRDGVDRCLEHARAAGADPVHEAADRNGGGYVGYFADPDGYRWEVACEAGELTQEVLP